VTEEEETVIFMGGDLGEGWGPPKILGGDGPCIRPPPIF